MSVPLPMWTLRAKAWDAAEKELGQSRREKREALQKALQYNADMGIETTPEMVAQLTDELGGPMAWLTGTFPSEQIVTSLATKANENAITKQMQQQQATLIAEQQRDEAATKLVADAFRSGELPEDDLEAVSKLNADSRYSKIFGDNAPSYIRKAKDLNQKEALTVFGGSTNIDEVPEWARKHVSDRIDMNRRNVAHSAAVDIAKSLPATSLRSTPPEVLRGMFTNIMSSKGINDPKMVDMAMESYRTLASTANFGYQQGVSDDKEKLGYTNDYALGLSEGRSQIDFANKYPQLRAAEEERQITALKTNNATIAQRAAKAMIDPSSFGGKTGDKDYARAVDAMAAKITAILGDYDLSQPEHADMVVKSLVETRGQEPGLKLVAKSLEANYKNGAFGKVSDSVANAKLRAIGKVGFAPGSSAAAEMKSLQDNFGKMVKGFISDLSAAPKEARAALAENQKRKIEAFISTARSAFINTQGGFSDYDMRTDSGTLEKLLEDMKAKADEAISKGVTYSPYGNNAPAAKSSTWLMQENTRLQQQRMAQGIGFIELSKAPPPAAPAPQPAAPMPTMRPLNAPAFSGIGYSPTYTRGKTLGWGGGMGR